MDTLAAVIRGADAARHRDDGWLCAAGKTSPITVRNESPGLLELAESRMAGRNSLASSGTGGHARSGF